MITIARVTTNHKLYRLGAFGGALLSSFFPKTSAIWLIPAPEKDPDVAIKIALLILALEAGEGSVDSGV